MFSSNKKHSAEWQDVQKGIANLNVLLEVLDGLIRQKQKKTDEQIEAQSELFLWAIPLLSSLSSDDPLLKLKEEYKKELNLLKEAENKVLSDSVLSGFHLSNVKALIANQDQFVPMATEILTQLEKYNSDNPKFQSETVRLFLMNIPNNIVIFNGHSNRADLLGDYLLGISKEVGDKDFQFADIINGVIKKFNIKKINDSFVAPRKVDNLRQVEKLSYICALDNLEDAKKTHLFDDRDLMKRVNKIISKIKIAGKETSFNFNFYTTILNHTRNLLETRSPDCIDKYKKLAEVAEGAPSTLMGASGAALTATGVVIGGGGAYRLKNQGKGDRAGLVSSVVGVCVSLVGLGLFKCSERQGLSKDMMELAGAVEALQDRFSKLSINVKRN